MLDAAGGNLFERIVRMPDLLARFVTDEPRRNALATMPLKCEPDQPPGSHGARSPQGFCGKADRGPARHSRPTVPHGCRPCTADPAIAHPRRAAGRIF